MLRQELKGKEEEYTKVSLVKIAEVRCFTVSLETSVPHVGNSDSEMVIMQCRPAFYINPFLLQIWLASKLLIHTNQLLCYVNQVDCCNAVLYGTSAVVIHRLQIVLNAAARFIVGLSKYEHITPVLRDILHWLPVPQRIQFNTATLTFDCIRGNGPAYFSSIACTVADNSGLPGLCSAERGDLFVP